MALITCSECGGKKSDGALMCPHCGKYGSEKELSFKKYPVETAAVTFAFFAILVGALGVLYGLFLFFTE